MQEYKNKVIVISGGLGDIGQALALAFLDSGAIVCAGDQFDLSTAYEKWTLLASSTANLHYEQVDVTNPNQVDAWLSNCRERFGAISICIPNAARVTLKDYRVLEHEEWKAEMEVNLHGSFFMANTCAKYFVEDNISGNIVFLGSWAAHAVHKNLPAYSVSKAAIRMLCQSMALEYAPYGIRVNEIAPGYVNAGLSKVVWAENPDLHEKAVATVPLRTILEANEIAQQVLWMCSSHCKHLTGASIVLDGGLSLIRP
ncbi:SDR family NAD(P)-dependent oxidoreductase [Sphingobacterium gobiense]|uniref:2-deoxy-D-gluconate 3-dehydrogenase n=1 Tax=Sphingobacterium gobiense TaxID=1382456 RepID=A0A2S9JI23_9SPHI|nr:SDR family oxidoreductase [Sphingobacterium gobiense]PRD52658.1 2-deoxy-D-gluconate 3-dehydrogenase [Sphingobacterium gobiense]